MKTPTGITNRREARKVLRAYKDANVVILEGVVNSEPKISRYRTGKSFYDIWFILTHRVTRKVNGSISLYSEWIPVRVVGPQALRLTRILRRGMFVYVRGSLASHYSLLEQKVTGRPKRRTIVVKTHDIKYTELTSIDDEFDGVDFEDFDMDIDDLTTVDQHPALSAYNSQTPQKP